MKWDFLIQLPNYKVPQRHTVTVRVQEKPKELEILQAFFSAIGDGNIDTEVGIVPVFVRVDFINHLLSQELVNIVNEWNGTLPIPAISETFFTKIKSSRNKIAKVIHYSIPTVFTLLFSAILHYGVIKTGTETSVTLLHIELVMFWLIGTGALLFTAKNIGKNLAQRAYALAKNYGKFRIFLITAGDRNEQQKLANQNKTLIQGFWGTALLSLVLNIVAGIITWVLTTGMN